MADFRRVVTALAVLALLTGFAVTASAQTNAFACSASAAVPPLLRAEGLTELSGDIVLNCTGGVPTLDTATIPTANIQVFFNTAVTSRLLSTSTSLTGASEAVLLVNEPTAVTSICAAGSSCPVTGTSTTAGVRGTNPFVTTNAFQGIVNANSVTFLGVPIEAPGSTGTTIYRITNVRVNAAAIGVSTSGVPTQVQALVSISGSTSVPLSNPQLTTGFVAPSLDFSVRGVASKTGLGGDTTSGPTFQQCVKQDKNRFGTLRYSELFATAFKLRGGTNQTTPGAIYNTESGLVLSSIGGANNAFTMGLADFGTRLRAVFNNVPTGVRLFVSTGALNGSATNNAILIQSEAVGTGAAASASATSYALNPTATDFNLSSDNSTATSVFELTPAAGTATAVWEVTATNTLSQDFLEFGVWASFSPNLASNTPGLGNATVSGSYAPVFTAATGGTASSSLPIPRFVDNSSPKSLFTIVGCRTNLLFPYVVAASGFDTGIAISNTSQDVFGTTPQTGDCTVTFFGDNAPAAFKITGIAAGKTSAFLASTQAPGFTGYAIAQCGFQFAHGFVFVSDLGARNLAMGYLALVIPDNADGKRKINAVNLSNGTGEVLGQ